MEFDMNESISDLLNPGPISLYNIVIPKTGQGEWYLKFDHRIELKISTLDWNSEHPYYSGDVSFSYDNDRFEKYHVYGIGETPYLAIVNAYQSFRHFLGRLNSSADKIGG
jgi:hypothetical protein